MATPEELDQIQYGSLLRQPITSTIPYLYRWKILQLKLMINDLKELCEKHGIASACTLQDTIYREAEEYLKRIKQDIEAKRRKIEAITK